MIKNKYINKIKNKHFIIKYIKLKSRKFKDFFVLPEKYLQTGGMGLSFAHTCRETKRDGHRPDKAASV